MRKRKFCEVNVLVRGRKVCCSLILKIKMLKKKFVQHQVVHQNTRRAVSVGARYVGCIDIFLF
jgi:hypothetical protein